MRFSSESHGLMGQQERHDVEPTDASGKREGMSAIKAEHVGVGTVV